MIIIGSQKQQQQQQQNQKQQQQQQQQQQQTISPTANVILMNTHFHHCQRYSNEYPFPPLPTSF